MAHKHELLKVFFPNLNWEGFCFAEGRSAIFSLFTDLNNLTKRDEWIKYGVCKDPKNPKERVSLKDMLELIQQEGLEKYIGILPELKSSDATEVETSQSIIDRVYEYNKQSLLKDLGVLDLKMSPDDIKSNLQLTTSSVDMGPIYPDLPDIKAVDLKKQIDLAWEIREAYLKKIKASPSKTPSYKKFLEKYPYIEQLNELEIHIGNLAQYQHHEVFPQFFVGKVDVGQQEVGVALTPLLAPVELDAKNSKPVQLVDFNVQNQEGVNLASLQSTLDVLAGLMQEHAAKTMNPNAKFPLALSIGKQGHTMTVGYDPTHKSWLHIDANFRYPRVVANENIAREIMIANMFGQHFYLRGKNTTLRLIKREGDNQFILVSAEKTSDTRTPEYYETVFQMDEDAIQAILKSPKIKFLKDISLNLNYACHYTPQHQKDMQTLITRWQDEQNWGDELTHIGRDLPTDYDKYIGAPLTQKDITEPDLKDQSLFVRNCRYEGNLALAEKLIQAPVFSHKMDTYYKNPVEWACYYGRKDIALLLVQHGANGSDGLGEAVYSGILDAGLANKLLEKDKLDSYWHKGSNIYCKSTLAHWLKVFARGEAKNLRKLIEVTADLSSIRFVINEVRNRKSSPDNEMRIKLLTQGEKFLQKHQLKFGVLKITEGTEESLLTDLNRLFNGPNDKFIQLCDEVIAEANIHSINLNLLTVEEQLIKIPCVQNFFELLNKKFPQQENHLLVKKVEEHILHHLREAYFKKFQNKPMLLDANQKLHLFRLHPVQKPVICKWLDYRLKHIGSFTKLGATEKKQLAALAFKDKNDEPGFVEMVTGMNAIIATNTAIKQQTFSLFQSAKTNQFTDCLSKLNSDLESVLDRKLDAKTDAEFKVVKKLFDEIETEVNLFKKTHSLQNPLYPRTIAQAAFDFNHFMESNLCAPAAALDGIVNELTILMKDLKKKPAENEAFKFIRAILKQADDLKISFKSPTLKK